MNGVLTNLCSTTTWWVTWRNATLEDCLLECEAVQTSRSVRISQHCFLQWLGSKWRKQVTAKCQHVSATLHSVPSWTMSSLHSKCHENLISHIAAFIFSIVSTSDSSGTDLVLKLVTCANTSVTTINSRITNGNMWHKILSSPYHSFRIKTHGYRCYLAVVLWQKVH